MSLVDDLLAQDDENTRQSLMATRVAETEAAATEAFQRMLTAYQAAQYGEALRLNDLVIALNTFRQDTASQVYAYLMRANLLTRGSSSDPDKARDAFQQALELARQHPQAQPMFIQVARGLADHSFIAGDLVRARQYCENALQLSEVTAPSTDIAYLHSRLATIHSASQDFTAALTHYRHAFDLYEQLNDGRGALEATLDIAYMQMNLRSFDAAMSTLHQAEERATGLQDLGRLTRARILQAQTVFLARQDFESARRLFLRAAETAEGADYAFAYLQAANMSLTMHRLADAQRYFEIALDGFRRVEDLKAQAACYAGLADTFERRRDLVQARKYLQDAQVCYQQANDSWGEMTIAQQAGALAWESGAFENALVQYRHALDLAESLNDLDTVAFAHNALGTIYENLNLIAEARDEYLASAQTYRELGNRAGEARSFAALAYLETENWRHVRTNIAKALWAARVAQDLTLLAQIHKQVADIYARQKQFSHSRRHADRALQIHRRLHLPDAMAQDWMDIGELESASGAYENARSAFSRAARWYRWLKLPAQEMLGEIAAAHAEFSLGLRDAARRRLERTLERLQASGVQNPIASFANNVGLGVIAERDGDSLAAVRYFQAAIAELENLRADFAIPNLAIEFIGSKANLYARTVRLLIGQQRAQALNVVEQAKSRAWLGLLAVTPFALSSHSVDVKIAEEEQSWLKRAQAILSRTHSAHPSAQALHELQEAFKHLDTMWIQMGNAEYIALRRGDPLTYQEIVDMLQSNDDRNDEQL